MKLALLFLLALPAHADELLDGILMRLAEPAVIRAQFVQERHITDITRPTVSRGRITVSREPGKSTLKIIGLAPMPAATSIAW